MDRNSEWRGELSGDFDERFSFQRGNGTLQASFAFELPEKGYSKTFFIYGVPVTAAVDLSGNVEIFVRGSAVLNRQLEFEEIAVAPGTTVTGNVTISVSAGSGTGFGSGVNVAQESPNSAALTGVYADAGVDADSDGIYEALAASVEVNILTTGNYEVRGDLYKGDQFILSAQTLRNGLATGTETFILSFPGGILSDRGLDGPYALKQVVVMDRNDSPVQTAFAAAPYATAAYQASQFIQGPLALDKASYRGTGDTALITVTDASANSSADSVQTIAVAVASTRDYRGFMLGLVETGPDTGIFQGTLGFSLLSSSQELERLLVVDHDLVQVIYTDPRLGYRFIETAL